MRHIDALLKGQLQHPVPVFHRFIDDMHVKFAGIIGKSSKIQKLKLNRERRVLHFKSAGDFLVWLELMDNPIEPMPIPHWVGGFKLVTTVPSALHFQHPRTHPLLHDVRLYVGFEKQVQGQIELSCNQQILFAGFGMDICFLLHIQSIVAFS